MAVHSDDFDAVASGARKLLEDFYKNPDMAKLPLVKQANATLVVVARLKQSETMMSAIQVEVADRISRDPDDFAAYVRASMPRVFPLNNNRLSA